MTHQNVFSAIHADAAMRQRFRQSSGMIQAALAAQQPRGCGCPSTPCGCQNPICTVLDSWVTRWANAQNIPAAQPAA